MSKFLFGAVGFTTLLLSTLGGCNKSTGSATTSGNLATVDGEPIPMSEFYTYLQHKPNVQVAAQGRSMQLPVAGSLGVQAMRDIVQRKMIEEVAKDEGVLPDQKAVDDEIAFHAKQSKTGDYVARLEKEGFTMDDIRKDTFDSLVVERLQTKGVVVSPDEAKAFIKKNPTSFTTQAQANLLILAVNDVKQKMAADADLKSGKTFAAVAMQYSIVPGAKQSGGEFQIHNVSEMDPALQALVKATPENKAADWKKDGANWIKFYVVSKTPAKPMPVDSLLVEEVQRELAKQKGQTNNADITNRIRDKMKSAKVEFTSSSYQDGWNQYVEQMAAAQSAAQKPQIGQAPPPKR